MASADGMQCQAQDAKFSQLNERIATTQCTRQCRQKWDICDFCIPKAAKRLKIAISIDQSCFSNFDTGNNFRLPIRCPSRFPCIRFKLAVIAKHLPQQRMR